MPGDTEGVGLGGGASRAAATARREDPESLILTFGEDFDLIGNVAEVAATLYCPVCGARKPNVYFLGGLGVVTEGLNAFARKLS